MEEIVLSLSIISYLKALSVKALPALQTQSFISDQLMCEIA